jgi:hypothetical protein
MPRARFSNVPRAIVLLTALLAGTPRVVLAGAVTSACPAFNVPSQGTFESNVLIDTGSQPLGAYTIAINYGSTVLTVNQVTGGTAQGFTDDPVTNPADFPTGRTRISAFNSTSKVSPAGIVHVATITFNVVGAPASSTDLVPEIITLVDTDEEDVPADPVSCEIVAGAGGTPTPTVTRTKTPTPAGGTPTRTPTPTGVTRTPTPAQTGAPPKQIAACRSAVAKEAAAFVRSSASALLNCEKKKIGGKLPANTDCNAEPATAEKITAARAKLSAAIGKKCGGADKACGGNLAGEIGGTVLGWPTTCPVLRQGSCAGAIGTDSCTGIATCLACLDQAAVERVRTLTFGALEPTDPKAAKVLNKCQGALGSATIGFLAAKASARQKCWDARLKGKHADDCTHPLAGADGKVEKAVTKAEDKLTSAICKACGGDDKLCGGSADRTLVEIGTAPACDALTVPLGGAVCSHALSTLSDLAECLQCVTEYAIDCVDRVAVPGVATVPPECAP